jgi:hypothetical protein
MSLKRWATRKDAVQRDIVEALETAGCEVWVIEKPVDLLTLYHGRWMPLECKTPQKNGKARKRNDQPEQAEVITRTRIPIVTTPIEALRAVGAVSRETNLR